MRAMAIAACLAALLISTSARAEDPKAAPQNEYLLNVAEGEAFPTASLPDLDGKPRSIADYRGKKLVLHIFASW